MTLGLLTYFCLEIRCIYYGLNSQILDGCQVSVTIFNSFSDDIWCVHEGIQETSVVPGVFGKRLQEHITTRMLNNRACIFTFKSMNSIERISMHSRRSTVNDMT